jgi:hypothetical protein
MSTMIKVARYHLANPAIYLVAPWAALGFAFAVNLAATLAQGSGPNPTKSLSMIFGIFFFLGVLSIARSLPFVLALAVSRRSYYLGTAGLALVLAAADGLAIAGLQAVERGTGGWGVRLEFFEWHYFLAGAWYLTWLTTFVVLALVFAYGMWFGLVYWRWDTVGLVVFVVAQVTAALLAVFLISANHDWHSVGHFFTTLTAAELTGALAALAVALLAGGLIVMRRVTV